LRTALAGLTLPPLALYVHLPWCERKCPYCDFNSHETQQLPEQAYIEALLRDLDSELPRLQGRSLTSIFIGGGTPSLFSAGAIARLMRGIGDAVSLSSDCEVTLEANPGSAEVSRFAGYRDAGVNRLSIGVQSFDSAALNALGRVHDCEQALAAAGIAKAAGFTHINLDLMHGLPGQSPAQAAADVIQALAQSTGHLSWYQLTIEPNTRFHRQPPVLPDDDALADIQAHGEILLEGAGFARYEVSAWSRPGSQCRHNLNYWTFGDFLAIGAGAHGKHTCGDSGVIERYWKTRKPDDYLARSDDFVAGSRQLGETELAGEFMLNALRLEAGFTPMLFESRTGLPVHDLAAPLERMIADSLLEQDLHGIRATPLGRRFLDTVVAEFFPESG